MWYRCLNDVFGYCKGEPEFEGGKANIIVIDKKPAYAANNTCKLDKATCGKYSTTHCSKETDDGGES